MTDLSNGTHVKVLILSHYSVLSQQASPHTNGIRLHSNTQGVKITPFWGKNYSSERDK